MTPEEFKKLYEETREQVIQDLKEKKVRLSYTTLKEFTSPVKFVNYLVEKRIVKKPKTESQLKGIIRDELLFTPQLVEKKWKFTDQAPTTDNQVGFAMEMIEKYKLLGSDNITDQVIADVFKNHYKSGSAEKTYEGLKEYILGMASGKKVVSQEMYDKAKEVIDRLNDHEEVQELFSTATDFQKKFEWEYEGWKNVMYLDALQEEGDFFDGKYTKDSSPEKFERDIRWMKYYFQSSVYCVGMMANGFSMPQCRILAYDDNFDFNIYDIEKSYLDYGIKEYRYKIQELNKMVDSERFNASYLFFKPTYLITKPKWIEGFHLDDDPAYEEEEY